MRKLLILFCCVLFIMPCLPSHAYAAYNSELPEYCSDIALLVNLDTDTVIFSKNADVRTAPASLTKVTTAVLAMEFCPDAETVITVPEYCVRLLDGTGSSMAGLSGGEQVTMKDLLYCLLLPSANEAANIVADYIGGGDIAVFIQLMNDFAAAIGCTDTHFCNPHGLDNDEHYTTASDMYKIIKHAMGIPLFREIIKTYEYTVPKTNKSEKRAIYSTNYLLNSYSDYYYEYCTGVKTGTTDNAGSCLAASASKDGYTYIALSMKGEFKAVDASGKQYNTAMLTCRSMFKWAFENIRLKVVADTARVVDEVAVELGKDTDHVALVPAQEVSALIPDSADVNSLMIAVEDGTKPESITAPVTKGQVVARAKIYYSNEVIAEVDLVAMQDVEKSLGAAIAFALKSFFTSKAFLFSFAALVLLVIFFALFMYDRKRRIREKQRRINVVKPPRESKHEDFMDL